MKYYKLLYHGEGGVRERLLTEPSRIAIINAMKEGRTHVMVGSLIVRISDIKAVENADDEVREYLSMGVSLKSLALESGEERKQLT